MTGYERVSTIVEYIRVVKIIDRKVPVLSTKDTLDLYLYFTFYTMFQR